MSYFYRMLCRNCGHEVRQGETTTFLKSFFAGKRCLKCGHYHNDRYYDEDWIITFGRYERSVKFDLFDVKTWFSKSTWKEKDE